MPIEVGQPAPDFTLPASDRTPTTLSAMRGTPVVVVFYPFAFTSVCEGELCSIRDDPTHYSRDGSQVLAISCDSVPTLGQWAKEKGWTFPVLSDFWPHGEVANQYGVFNDKVGCANRASFVIDGDGTVVDTFQSGGLGEARPAERYDEALARLG